LEYKTDDGEWTGIDGTVSYSTAEGEHTVTARVKVSGDDTASEASVSYETAATSLGDISVEGNVAGWSAVAKTIYIKIGGGEFTVTEADGYTFAETGTITITVKAEGGFDAENAVFYAGEAIEKTAEITNTVKLSSPTVTLGEEGVSWQPVENATGYMISVDGAAFADAADLHCAFSETSGGHTVKIIAKGDGTHYTDSDEVTASYTVKTTSISFTKQNSSTGTVSGFDGTTLEINHNGAYVNVQSAGITLPYTYDAAVSGSREFDLRATGGFDSATSTYYIGSYGVKFMLLAPGEKVVLEDANDKVSADLADEWTVEKYTNSGWESALASIGVAEGDGVDGTEYISFNCWNNDTSFKYHKDFDALGSYNAITFDYKGDGINDLIIRLYDQRTGIYASIDIGVMPAYWQNKTVSIYDGNWNVTYAGQKIGSFVSVFSNTSITSQFTGELANIRSIDELISYFGGIDFVLKGHTANGTSCKLYADNVAVEYIENVQSSTVQYLNKLSNDYIGEKKISETESVVMTLTVTGASAATLATLNLASNISMNMSMVIEGDTVTLKDADNGGTVLTVKGKFTYNGATVTVTEATGSAGAQITSVINGSVFVAGKLANHITDFEDGTLGSAYNSSAWTQEHYKSVNGEYQWSVVTGQMNCRDKNGSKVVNMANGAWTSGRFTYTPSVKVGVANYFSVDMGNYFSGATATEYRIIIIDSNGATHYVAGGANSWETLAVTTDLNKTEFWLDESIDVVSVRFVINGASAQKYTYIDNITLKYAFRTEDDNEINLNDYENLTAAENFSGYSVNSGSAVAPNSTYFKSTADFYVRNDSGSGYDDTKYISAKYANTGNTTSATITYTPGTGRATEFSVAIANNRNANATNVTVVIKIYDVNDQVVATKEITMEAGAGWQVEEVEFEETAINKITVTVTSIGSRKGDAYIKLDNFSVGGGTAA
ncbi:MAG: hypothetical protein J6Z34_03415, partial [Clostridia bacterium]|nr:hypothetical protein [Clostridia bacterium]